MDFVDQKIAKRFPKSVQKHFTSLDKMADETDNENGDMVFCWHYVAWLDIPDNGVGCTHTYISGYGFEMFKRELNYFLENGKKL